MSNKDEDKEEHHNLAEAHPEIVAKLFEIIKKEHITPQFKKFIMNPLEEIYKAE